MNILTICFFSVFVIYQHFNNNVNFDDIKTLKNLNLYIYIRMYYMHHMMYTLYYLIPDKTGEIHYPAIV